MYVAHTILTLLTVLASVTRRAVAVVGVPLADAHASVLAHDLCAKILLCGTTFCGAVVGDEAGHVDGLAVDPEVSHAAHEVSVSDREVLR